MTKLVALIWRDTVKVAKMRSFANHGLSPRKISHTRIVYFMSEGNEFIVTYWGTTGSFARIPTPLELRELVEESLREFQQRLGASQNQTQLSRPTIDQLIGQVADQCLKSYAGGNTTCIEIQSGELKFLVDAGTGLQSWSAALTENPADTPCHGHIFLTHAHLDHVSALPFAEPLFDQRNSFTLWATTPAIRRIRELFGSRTEKSLFPFSLDVLKGLRELREIVIDEGFQIGDIRVTACALNHPGDAIALRFESEHTRIVIATDHEHATDPDQNLARFAHATDLLYLDAQYLQTEYDGKQSLGNSPAQSRMGWGHSTVEACILTAAAAQAKQLHLGHHDPRRSVRNLLEIQQRARDLMAQQTNSDCEIHLAREGEVWRLPK